MAKMMADDDEVGKRLKELLASRAPIGEEHPCTCGAAQRCRCFLPPPPPARAVPAAASYEAPHIVVGQGDENAPDD